MLPEHKLNFSLYARGPWEGPIGMETAVNPSLLWIHGKRTFLPFVALRFTESDLRSGLWKEHYVVCEPPFLFCTLAKVLNSSSIIEDIKALRKTRSASLAYFYFDFRDEDKRSQRSLLLSIISQLSAQSNLCCGVLSRLHSAHDDGAQKPSDSALKHCLEEMLSLPVQGPTYLIFDALDECPNNSGLPTAREEVLDLVNALVSLRLPNLHVCVTSRPEIDIQTALEPLTSLRVSLHNQNGQKKDIVDYVSSVVYSDPNLQRWREEDKTLVIETLSERADGM